MVRPIVLRLTGRLDADCIATGYLALVLAAAKFDPGRGVPFAAFARTEIHNRVCESLRKRRVPETGDVEDPQAEDPGLELRIDIQRAIEALPEPQRLQLHLRFWKGLSIEDAAREAGCSRTVAVERRRAAIAALRVKLGPVGQEKDAGRTAA